MNDAIVQNDVAHAEHMLADVTQTIHPQDEPLRDKIGLCWRIQRPKKIS